MKSIKQNLILFCSLLFFSPFIIYDFRLSTVLYPLMFIMLPILIYSLVTKKKSIFLIAFTAVLLICYVLLSIVILFRFVLCGYSQTKYAYVNRHNQNIKLVGRDYSCYGTMGDLVLYKQYSVSSNIKFEIYYKTFVNYENVEIDTTEWIRIE